MSDPYVPSLNHPANSGRRSKVINDTASHTGLNAELIQVTADAQIESITAPGKTNSEDLCGPTLPAGFQIAGPVTQIKLTSGVVEAHEQY